MVKSILPVHLQGAVVRRKGKKLVGPVNWQISPEGISVLMGPNGAGKSTLLRLIHGLERPSDGHLQWPVSGEARFQPQSFVFQSPVIMRRSVLENVIYPLRVRGVPAKEAEDMGRHWLSRVGLEALEKAFALQLSGGERQKLALARAMITGPQLLYLDEPTANLDGAATLLIEQMIEEARDKGVRILMATHDPGQGRRLADEVVFLHKGDIIEITKGPQFFESPTTDAARTFLKGDILI